MNDSTTPAALAQRRDLRRDLRSRRRALGRCERIQYAKRICASLWSSGVMTRATRVGCYLANDGEPDLGPVMERLRDSAKRAYLPALKGQSLAFLPYQHGAPLRPNRFGIAEPDLPWSHRCAPLGLDVVLMPLVGFDDDGNRLGMGGGFYDRCFAYLRRHKVWHRPKLVGVAFEFQRVAQLPAQVWDVPLAAVVTEGGVRAFFQEKGQGC